jgi:hypothetical protein
MASPLSHSEMVDEPNRRLFNNVLAEIRSEEIAYNLGSVRMNYLLFSDRHRYEYLCRFIERSPEPEVISSEELEEMTHQQYVERSKQLERQRRELKMMREHFFLQQKFYFAKRSDPIPHWREIYA